MSFQQCILWNNTGNSDKIWGVTEYQGQPVSFWGRRCGELKFKLLDTRQVDSLISEKEYKRGYSRTTFDILEGLQPGFKENFEHMLIMCIVSESFHRYTTWIQA